MNDMNKVFLCGRLTADAVLEEVKEGLTTLKFCIAVNRDVKEGDQWVRKANFFYSQIFGDYAKSMHNFLKKGQQIIIEGKLKNDRWTDKDGKQMSRMSLVTESIQLVGGKKSDEGEEFDKQAEEFWKARDLTSVTEPETGDIF